MKKQSIYLVYYSQSGAVMPCLTLHEFQAVGADKTCTSEIGINDT